jgi:quercetin dioxygenase-like cupin family protein
MAKAGDEFIRPNGERLTFRKTSRETNGELLEMEMVYSPNSSKPPSHYHPNQDEHFEVLRGTIVTEIGGQVRSFEAGDSFYVPRGTHHWMYNTSSEPGTVIWQVQPALETETLFETLWGLGIDGKSNDNGIPNLLQIAVLFREYRREFRLSKPPHWLQKILFAILAPIGKFLGYQTKYEKYSKPGQFPNSIEPEIS